MCTNKLEYVVCSHNPGCLLLDDGLRGHLYTREVWIQDMSEEDLDHGIDINELAYRPKCVYALSSSPCV